MLSDTIHSWIRTFVPWLVGLGVGWLASIGLPIDSGTSAQLIAAVAGVAGSLYYLLARYVERRWPQWTWLLGSSHQPAAYTKGSPDDYHGRHGKDPQ